MPVRPKCSTQDKHSANRWNTPPESQSAPKRGCCLRRSSAPGRARHGGHAAPSPRGCGRPLNGTLPGSAEGQKNFLTGVSRFQTADVSSSQCSAGRTAAALGPRSTGRAGQGGPAARGHLRCPAWYVVMAASPSYELRAPTRRPRQQSILQLLLPAAEADALPRAGTRNSPGSTPNE